ncbi:protein adenylyltransferase SelO family protein [Pacificimonas pallii]|uniref:protein adenylyltransferase SelO family protein n=1 Tax=Pacificimonas pallii TaxID=2827236 RepID=UPI002101F1B8|nr:YdiU family protein [Pacificimonas pallii]
MTAYRADPAILSLGEDMFAAVTPAAFPETVIRFRNDRAAAEVGLDHLNDVEWARHFGRFEALPDNLRVPLALAYHGHQFRSYNPDIGDGRGFLFAQLRDGDGRLMDLGTKGTGRTPFSRTGDGRLTLKGGVREILATEMLEALGVETSRTFSIIETGEALTRGDEPSPTRSAAMVRLSHSHIRYGSFQRLAYRKDAVTMERLTDYCLAHLAGMSDVPDRYAALMDYAVSGAARLAASYRAAGFVHGVLNTDNINITGESFDYGPWRFAPRWDDGFTAAYFDQFGLYSFGRQAEALQWNVHQLALALRTVAEADSLIPALKSFPDRYEAALAAALLTRLGIQAQDQENDTRLARAWEAALAASEIEPDRAFFDWRGGTRRRDHAAYETPAFHAFAALATDYSAVPGATDHEYWSNDAPCSMLIEEMEALWAPIAEDDDWAPLESKIDVIRRMGEAHEGLRVPDDQR